MGGRWKEGAGEMTNAEWRMTNGRRHRGAIFLENMAERSPGRALGLQKAVHRSLGDAPFLENMAERSPGRAPTLQKSVNRSPGDAPFLGNMAACGLGRAPPLQTTVNRSLGDAPDVQKAVDCGPGDGQCACGAVCGCRHQRRRFRAGGAFACSREGKMQKNHLRPHCPRLDGQISGGFIKKPQICHDFFKKLIKRPTTVCLSFLRDVRSQERSNGARRADKAVANIAVPLTIPVIILGLGLSLGFWRVQKIGSNPASHLPSILPLLCQHSQSFAL